MALVYHLKPANMLGATLIPLNQLATQHPEIYERHVAKYQGREALLTRRIPLLDCLWNDVLFFSSVHPQAIRDGFIVAGKNWQPRIWYEIDTLAAGFNEQNTVIYHPDTKRIQGDFTLSHERVEPFAADKLTTIDDLPAESLRYYQEAAANNQPIFAWRGLIHILFRGTVAVSNAEIEV